MERVQLCIGVGFGLALALGQLAITHAHPLTFPTLVRASIIPQGRNEIYGTVFVESRRPQADIYVELFDDFNAPLRHTKTDASGRFSFTGLINGRYIIKALPYGTDYMEESTEVTLSAVSASPGSGSDTQHVDIYLRVNERIYASPFAATPGVIFAQDVPPAARKLYEEGVRYLHGKKEREGLESLKKSIEIFPSYYMALDRLGAEYALRGLKNAAYLQAGFALLTRAVEINPRGFSSVFGLGWTQYHLGLNSEAIESLRRATNLYDKAGEAHLWLGKALRRASSEAEAEVAFKRSDKLANGKSSEVHWQLAELYNNQKRYKEAADRLESFLKLQPKAANAEKIRGLIKELRDKAAAAKS